MPAPAGFDAERAFLYNVDGRGQSTLDELGLLDALVNQSVSQEEFRLSMVTDTDKPVGEPLSLPVVDLEQRRRVPAQWIPRSKLVALMDDAVADTAERPSATPPVERIYGRGVASLRVEEGAHHWRVGVEGTLGGGAQEELTASLVVGADGLSSAVRDQLASLAGGSAFAVRKRPSASAGLRYKVLALPPKFPLSTRSSERAEPSMAYSLRGKPSVPRPIKAGILPLRTDEMGRTANFITREDHPIWDKKDAPSMAAFLADNFPHIPLNEETIGKEELARFAASRGGRFPRPQHCTDAAYVPEGGGGCAAIIAGDALHAFPPDLGQGVNSGLQDISVFAKKLDAHAVRFGARDDADAPADAPPPGLAPAAEEYAGERVPEASALTRLMQLGYPFQYGQECFMSKPRQAFWAVNMLARLKLSKVFRGILHPQIMTQVQNPTLAYSRILATANRTTMLLRLVAAGAVAVAIAVGRHLRLGVL